MLSFLWCLSKIPSFIQTRTKIWEGKKSADGHSRQFKFQLLFRKKTKEKNLQNDWPIKSSRLFNIVDTGILCSGNDWQLSLMRTLHSSPWQASRTSGQQFLHPEKNLYIWPVSKAEFSWWFLKILIASEANQTSKKKSMLLFTVLGFISANSISFQKIKGDVQILEWKRLTKWFFLFSLSLDMKFSRYRLTIKPDDK